jgi:hypothetical protein
VTGSVEVLPGGHAFRRGFAVLSGCRHLSVTARRTPSIAVVEQIEREFGSRNFPAVEFPHRGCGEWYKSFLRTSPADMIGFFSMVNLR